MIKLHNIDFHTDLHDDIKSFLIQRGYEFSQAGIHFGNCCLINIPDNLIQYLKDSFPEIQYRNEKRYLETEDLENFNIGDKVFIEYLETDFFPVRNERDTIYDKKKDGLIIRAYKSKTRGYIICTSDNTRIKKV